VRHRARKRIIGIKSSRKSTSARLIRASEQLRTHRSRVARSVFRSRTFSQSGSVQRSLKTDAGSSFLDHRPSGRSTENGAAHDDVVPDDLGEELPVSVVTVSSGSIISERAARTAERSGCILRRRVAWNRAKRGSRSLAFARARIAVSGCAVATWSSRRAVKFRETESARCQRIDRIGAARELIGSESVRRGAPSRYESRHE